MGTAELNTVAQGFVSSAYMRVLFEYLKNQGIDASKLLNEPTPDEVDRVLVRYPLQRWVSHLQSAAACLEDPLLGLHLGKTVTPAHFGVVGYIMASCPTLGATLLRLQAYERLVHEVDQHPMEAPIFDGGDLVVKWPGGSSGGHGRLNQEFSIATFFQFSKSIASQDVELKQVSFINPEPSSLHAYRDFFKCEVLFNQAVTSVRLPLHSLTVPVKKPEPILIALLEKQANEFLNQLPTENEFVMSVRRCITSQIHEGEPELDSVASRLNMTPRTLRRRLDQYDTSFRALLDAIRQHLAQQYLLDPALQLSDIAQLLGYSEQSTFNRAFLRWTGSTPNTYRRSIQL
ncbi:AraC family transcriptional regulator ligand-binding domain-containing protein [Collimonas sp. H4R21]|jgi:AraC-like DNA-binding protein|uniref:AraC family transcriptional regulator ligand-binding domain-containing protein n=1 Tax=Collimonas rhizosphaerae TaxID=3126357 RepID=A0ABU9PZL9_9BURK|nr:AraC family transcriptional regulator [Collimonas sp. OK412]